MNVDFGFVVNHLSLREEHPFERSLNLPLDYLRRALAARLYTLKKICVKISPLRLVVQNIKELGKRGRLRQIPIHHIVVLVKSVIYSDVCQVNLLDILVLV